MATIPPLAPDLRRTTKARRLLCPWGRDCPGRRCSHAHPSRPAMRTTEAPVQTR